MLDGLDDIPWKDLRHAYGPAGDVPALIRGERIFYGSFVQFGLPDTASGWRDLAASLPEPG